MPYLNGGSISTCHGNIAAADMLDESLKDFIVNPTDLPWKWVKRLAASGERVNHDSQWKCTTSTECKTGISAVVMVTSGLGPLRNRWWTLMIRMMKMLTNDYCLCHSLFMFTWSCVLCGLVNKLVATQLLNDDSLKVNRSKTSVSLFSLMNPMLYLLSTTCTYACFTF